MVLHWIGGVFYIFLELELLHNVFNVRMYILHYITEGEDTLKA